jgi:hypothetical protein
MAIRINPDLNNTEEVLTELLKGIMSGDGNNRVMLLVPANGAFHMCARIRTQISRKRKKLEKKGVKPKRFTLRSTVHPETHNGIRHDCIVFWREINDSHTLTEILEDLLSNG